MNLELQTLSVKNNQPLHKFSLDNFYNLLLTFWKLSNMILCQIQQRGDRKIGELLAYKNLIKKKYLYYQSHLLQIIIREDSWVPGDGAELEVVGKSEDDGEDDPRSSQQQTRSQPSKIRNWDQNSYGALSLDTRYITVKQCWWHFL